jgi:membrane protein implicated in regulation of membrane protease activity
MIPYVLGLLLDAVFMTFAVALGIALYCIVRNWVRRPVREDDLKVREGVELDRVASLVAELHKEFFGEGGDAHV